MPLYLTIEIFTIAIPLLLSFDKKVKFYKMWKSLFISIFISAAFYITADIIFVKLGVWGFNPKYLAGIYFLNLPLEEWLFFILIPYSCLFIHYVFIIYFPKTSLSIGTVKIISALIIFILLLTGGLNTGRLYTLIYSVLIILILLAALVSKINVLNTFFLSFLIILVPFFMVNAILTGTFIDGEVVWYNNSEILGIRLLTVPVEDIGYAFSLILMNLLLMENFRKRIEKRKI
jgi:lycopene cyclase domain-containing protein